MTPPVDVLIPTCDRVAALAVTLAGLVAQDPPPARVVVADQTPGGPAYDAPAVAAVVRVLRHRGVEVELHARPERRGVAEQRDFLLGRAAGETALMLDDDVLLEPGAVRRLLEALEVTAGSFVGMPLTGLTHLDDVRPDEQTPLELWNGPVRPERVRKETPAWERWRLHNAANPVHLAAELLARGELAPGGWVAYKVAWVGGCVLYRTAALRAVGGFAFWPELGPHGAGEDVAAQLLLLERYGGAGVLPTLAHHLELETTLPRREVDGYAAVTARAG